MDKEKTGNGFFQKVANLFKKETKILNGVYQSRGYRASKQSNSNMLWNRVTTTEDSDIYRSLGALRARSRELAQNNPVMKHYLVMLENNVVGKSGFKLQVLGQDTNGKLDIIGNQAVSKAWNDWTLKENCDISEKQNFLRMNATIIKTLAKDGECLIKIIREKSREGNKYGFKLQLLDVERLDINLNKDLEGGYIRMGVEMNLYGKPVAYWLRKYDVKDSSYMSGTLIANDYERVPCKDMIHLFMTDSAEQTRGVPWAHAVMIYMEDMDDYNKTTLMAAKVGAASSIYLERDAGVNTNQIADKIDDNGDYVAEMGFGEIRSLPAGSRFKSMEMNFPSDAYEVYTKRLLQLIAGGLGLSHVFLGNDTQDLNYSTARTIILEERVYFETLQNFIVDNFLNRVYKEWLEQSLLNGKIIYNNGLSKIGVDKLEKFSNHNYIGRRWEGIDPAKEEMSTNLAYRNMTKPLSTILAERGLDLSEVIAQYKQDAEILKTLGEDFQLFNPSQPKEPVQEVEPIKKEDLKPKIEKV